MERCFFLLSWSLNFFFEREREWKVDEQLWCCVYQEWLELAELWIALRGGGGWVWII
jgi:hypothetical protein